MLLIRFEAAAQQSKILSLLSSLRSSHRRCSLKKGFLRNFAKLTGNHLRQKLFINKVAGLTCRPQACIFIKIETLAQVFSCGFCEISKSTLFIGHLWATASVHCPNFSTAWNTFLNEIVIVDRTIIGQDEIFILKARLFFNSASVWLNFFMN